MRRLTLPLSARACARLLAVTATVALLLGAQAQEVIPDFYKDPGLYPNRSYVNQSFNEHIDPFSGSLQHHYVDLHIPGNGGFDLKVVRSYNSASVEPTNPALYESLAGLGWTIHFGRVLKKGNASICLNTGPAYTVSDNPVVELPDGSRQLFAFTGATSPLMMTTQRWKAECLGAGTGLTVYSPDGTQYEMTKLVNVGTTAGSTVYAWYATKITDRNGNYATINYAAGASPEITGVTTNDGRTISFTYDGSGTASRRVTSISSSGKTYSYAYQAVTGVTDRYFLTTVTRPGGTTWQYAYNGNLNNNPGSYIMNQVTYPQGGTHSYSYGFVYFDSQANPNSRSTVVTGKTRSAGGSWTFAYTPGAPSTYDTTTVTSPSGTTTYRHVGPNYTSSGTVWMVGLLMQKVIGSVQTETYSWSNQSIGTENNFRPGAFVTKVDTGIVGAPVQTQKSIVRNGATYTTTYSGFDAYGNPTSVVESGPSGGSRTTTLSYYINTTKWIVKQLQNESYSGSSTTRTFDTNGNLTSVTRDGVATSLTYDAQGNVASATFPRSLTHSYSNYKRGIPQTESQPEAISLTRVVSDAGNVTSETNGDGRTTGYGYDGLDRITSVTYPVGTGITISYGTTTRTATRGALTETTTYNGFGDPVSINLGGVSRTFTVDALGRRTFQSYPGSATGTSYQYDMLDRVTRVTNADNTFSTITYGAGTKAVVDERSKSTTYTYRSYGNPDQQFLMGITAADTSANVTIVRNARDLITSVAQGGQTRTYGYNSNYYVTSAVNPETGTATFGRDAAGNLTSKKVGAAATVTYVYDGQNRITTTTYPAGTPSVTKTYNKTHKLLTATSSTGARSFSYDWNNNMTGETLVVDGITLATTYAYNGLDQLTSVTYPSSGTVINYSPDALGRPTQVSGYATAVTYWPSGQVKQIDYANGTVTNYNQDARLRPSTFTTQLAGGATFINNAYSYDGVSNLTGITDTIDSTYNRTLTYDNINRITGANGPWGTGTITYTGGGNILSQVLGTSSLFYSYDASNRLASVSGVRSTAYTYDNYGNIATGLGSTYQYDDAPNLRCVNCADPENLIEYAYDGVNLRSRVTKSGAKTYELHSLKGNQLIEFTPNYPGAPGGVPASNSGIHLLTEYIYLGGKRIAQKKSSTINVYKTLGACNVWSTTLSSLNAEMVGAGVNPSVSSCAVHGELRPCGPIDNRYYQNNYIGVLTIPSSDVAIASSLGFGNVKNLQSVQMPYSCPN